MNKVPNVREQTSQITSQSEVTEEIGLQEGKLSLPKRGMKRSVEQVDARPLDVFLENKGLQKGKPTGEVIDPPAKRKAVEMSESKSFDEHVWKRNFSSARNAALANRAALYRIPDFFIDSKEGSKAQILYGADVVSEHRRDASLMFSGQEPQSKRDLQQVYLVFPWLHKVLLIGDYSKIVEVPEAEALLVSAAEIGYLTDLDNRNDVSCLAAPARIDLILRFGLLGAKRSVDYADYILALIPQDKQKYAYSYALQNAVEFDSLEMVEYCLKKGGCPLPPDDEVYDYREETPLELAFALPDETIAKRLLSRLDPVVDSAEVRTLFFDKNRWDKVLAEVNDFLSCV